MTVTDNIWFYDSPIGEIGIAECGCLISNIIFGRLNTDNVPQKETDLIKNASVQLSEYFRGERRIFDLPLYIRGTDFKVTVLNELMKIPYGETRSYSYIAQEAGRPAASRAVGMANNKNPLAIIIPCHRVIGKSGNLTGYAGGLSKKRYLLDFERMVRHEHS